MKEVIPGCYGGREFPGEEQVYVISIVSSSKIGKSILYLLAKWFHGASPITAPSEEMPMNGERHLGICLLGNSLADFLLCGTYKTKAESASASTRQNCKHVMFA